MDKIYRPRGFVEIEYYRPEDDMGTCEPFYVESKEQQIENLVLNNFRRVLPLLLAPKLITGRADNSPGNDSWLDRRVAMIGFGIGDGGVPPTVLPEDPEDGAVGGRLVGGPEAPNSTLGIQAPIRRIPTVPGTPSEQYTAATPILPFHLFKEVDADGISIVAFEGGGAEIVFTFTVEEDEYIGNIMEYTLFMGGGDSSDDAFFSIVNTDPLPTTVQERRRLSRTFAGPIPIARKTRTFPIEKTTGFKFRARWRLRT
jgi:hypothetical protein